MAMNACSDQAFLLGESILYTLNFLSAGILLGILWGALQRVMMGDTQDVRGPKQRVPGFPQNLRCSILRILGDAQ